MSHFREDLLPEDRSAENLARLLNENDYNCGALRSYERGDEENFFGEPIQEKLEDAVALMRAKKIGRGATQLVLDQIQNPDQYA